jgi:hypothetical protein
VYLGKQHEKNRENIRDAELAESNQRIVMSVDKISYDNILENVPEV